jgi:hypothetical protein
MMSEEKRRNIQARADALATEARAVKDQVRNVNAKDAFEDLAESTLGYAEYALKHSADAEQANEPEEAERWCDVAEYLMAPSRAYYERLRIHCVAHPDDEPIV